MWSLYQFPLCPFSRKIRLLMGEKNIAYQPVREDPWNASDHFYNLNPAGRTPVLVDDKRSVVIADSRAIGEYLEETVDRLPMISGNATARAEIRRLTALFDENFFRDVTEPLLNERMKKRIILSNRTDDPNRRVGCVIVLKGEIVAIGWNGFPAKALYGNHPRLGKSEDKAKRNKYPHVIHAEQNALMRRNRRNLDGATAFVNKIPCNECLPMLCDAGVKELFLSKVAFKDEKDPPKSEKNFYDLQKNPDSSLAIYKQE
ncbi:MAG: glutathione S-transferase N-terminal domain-containing protein [Pseudomonadota bacterium]